MYLGDFIINLKKAIDQIVYVVEGEIIDISNRY